MIVRGPHRRTNFTIIDNAVLDDDRLTFRARGLLNHLLGKPEGWRITATQLAQGESVEGRNAILTALKELETVGYLVRKKLRLANGQFTQESIIYDTPMITDSDGKNSQFTGVQDSDFGFPNSRPPTSESSTVSNKNYEQILLEGKSDILPVDNSTCEQCEATGWIMNDDGVAARCSECA